MPRTAYRPPGLEYEVFLGSEAVRRGLLTEHQLRGMAWRRLRQNVYADARLPLDHRLACRAVGLRMPPGVVVAGPSAAHLLGVEHAASFRDDVHVITPPGVRVGAQQGLKVHVQEIDPEDVVLGAAIPRTSRARTAFDVAAWLSPARAVAIIDAMLHRRLVTHADLAAVLAHRTGRRGQRRARLVFALVDGGAATPEESRLRVRLVFSGIPRPVLHHPLAADGPGRDPAFRLDMAWPAFHVALAYDRRRAALLAAAGWLVVHAPPRRVAQDFPGVLAAVRRALYRRGWHSGDRQPALTATVSGTHAAVAFNGAMESYKHIA